MDPVQLLDEADEDRKKSRRERGKARLMEFYNYLISRGMAKKNSYRLSYSSQEILQVEWFSIKR